VLRYFRYHPGVAGFLLGLGVLAFCGLVAATFVIGFGAFNTAASARHSSLVAWALHRTMIGSVKVRASGEYPDQFSEAQVQEGFADYEQHCVACHGGPGVARAAWVMGMEPTPPYLIDAARQWNAAQLRVIVAQGVKMTGMPAWEATLPPEKISSLVAFLEELPNISAVQYAKMRAQRLCEAQDLPSDAFHAPSAACRSTEPAK